MQRKIAVITGASSGIGLEAARELVTQGWHVIAVGRNPGRAEAAEAELREAASQGGQVTMLRADLSLVAESDRLAAEIAALTDRVDVLANNAGGMTDRQVVTTEGLEQNFASNHVGPFRLTERLLPLLRKAVQANGEARIINTSSDASEMIPGINCDDLQNLGNWSEGAAYCTGKLANVLHARGLAAQLAGEGIVAHSFHPGAVDTNFFSHASEGTQERTRDLPKRTPQQGADTLVWLATSPEGAGSSGTYWHDRAPREPNKVAEDPELVDRFWQASQALVAKALG